MKSWRDVFCKVLEEIYKEKEDLTPILGIRGRKRFYVSKDKNILFSPLEVKNSPYFCEGNLSANSIVKIIKKILSTFNYNQDDLKIFCN